ncbi:uncharacterized [Tachysurus ichikawai]
MSNGCTAGFHFNAESNNATLFKLSVPDHKHWSKATEAVTFDRSDWNKFHKWCKDFDYIVREDFSPEVYEHKWWSDCTTQHQIYCIEARNISKDQLSLYVSTMIFGGFTSDKKEKYEVRFDPISWHDLHRFFNHIDYFFRKKAEFDDKVRVQLNFDDE